MNSIRHTQGQLLVASGIGYVDCDAKFAPTPSYFTSGQHFLEAFALLPETTRTTNSRWLQTFLSSNSKHDFCYTMVNISPSHIQQCLNLTMHFSLRHLAAKIFSQLYHNFISFPYFFPSYETCSINVNPLFHAAIKNLPIKHFDILELLSFIYLTNLARKQLNVTNTLTLQHFNTKNNDNIPSLNIFFRFLSKTK